MKVIFQSRDFASVEGAGLGFNNRRPMGEPWHYQGRVQHRNWQGTYECHWDSSGDPAKPALKALVWTVHGDARLFGLAAALKSMGFAVDAQQD
jgi:hypothetical protein